MNNKLGKHSIGLWCRRGAWLVAVIGLAEIAALIFSRYSQFPFLGTSSDPLFAFYFVTLLLQPALSVLASTVFYFLVLYAIGFGCDHFFGQAAPQHPPAYSEDNEILEEPLPRR
ncbi:MAG TPA: hypothetical protein VH540_23060 [Ktedonobacterales bacterium]|jgi:hypothetical protein